MRIQVLSPAPAVYANPRASSNAHSCVLRVQVADHAVLLTGDVPARQEASLLAWANQPGWSVRSDLMVAPHHGSHTSSSEALIAAVGPRWVSMQLGYRNHFGHPHDEVLRRYAAHQVRVLRSDQAGAVQWRFASALPLPGGPDDDVTIEVWRESHRRYWHWGAPDFLSLDQPAAVAGGPTMEAVSPAGEDP
jgi:competence protein ComEC